MAVQRIVRVTKADARITSEEWQKIAEATNQICSLLQAAQTRSNSGILKEGNTKAK